VLVNALQKKVKENCSCLADIKKRMLIPKSLPENGTVFSKRDYGQIENSGMNW